MCFIYIIIVYLYNVDIIDRLSSTESNIAHNIL